MRTSEEQRLWKNHECNGNVLIFMTVIIYNMIEDLFQSKISFYSLNQTKSLYSKLRSRSSFNSVKKQSYHI